MKTSNYCAISVFVLLAALTVLTSARPRFDRRELRKRRNTLEEALMIHPTISTDQGKESQGEENEAEMKTIFEREDLETSPSPVVTKTTPPRLPTIASSEADITKDTGSHQAKRRVRRRCLPGWFCPHPTKRRLRQKQAHHKRNHQRHHYNNL